MVFWIWKTPKSVILHCDHVNQRLWEHGHLTLILDTKALLLYACLKKTEGSGAENVTNLSHLN